MRTPLFNAQVSLPSDNEIKVARSFAAPRALVYEAYTTPSLVQRWLLGPPGWSMPTCEMDVRVDGEFHWRWRNDQDGREFGFHGRYEVVSPPKRLVSTEFFDPGVAGGHSDTGVIVTIELTEEDGATRLVSLMKYGSKAARDTALSTGMTDGMEQSYQRLDRVLSAHRSPVGAGTHA